MNPSSTLQIRKSKPREGKWSPWVTQEISGSLNSSLDPLISRRPEPNGPFQRLCFLTQTKGYIYYLFQICLRSLTDPKHGWVPITLKPWRQKTIAVAAADRAGFGGWETWVWESAEALADYMTLQKSSDYSEPQCPLPASCTKGTTMLIFQGCGRDPC